MNVIVTGYNGFIGRHLTQRLLNEGHMVIGIDDLSNSNDDFDPDLSNATHFEVAHIKIQDIDQLRPNQQIDVIFHLAAKARVQPSFENPVEWHDTNVTGTLKLLEFAKVNKIKKFIFSSSSSVYGEMDYDQPVGEQSRLMPMSPYALQKKHAEELCEFYLKFFDIDAVCLRYFNVYGENQPITGNYPQLVPILLDRYKKNLPFVIYGDGHQRRDFTYVGDVVDANIKASQDKISGIFNIGTGTNYSVNEICSIIDPKHPREYLSPRQEPSVTLASISRAQSILKWTPTTNLAEWIKSQI